MEKKDKYSIKFYKGINKITSFYLDKLYKPTIIGKENIKDKEGILLIGNHISGYDILLIAYALKEYDPRFMAKKEFFNTNFKWFFEKAGAFPIDRDKLDLASIRKTINLLKELNIVVIFPEGTRNRTDDIMLPFKPGISSIALSGKVKVIPFAITGKYKFRSNIMIEFGKAIDLKELDINKKELDGYLENKVKQMILKNSR